MVLQNIYIPEMKADFLAKTTQAKIGDITSVNSFSGSLDTVRATITTVTVDDTVVNELNFKVTVPTSIANGFTINAINLELDTISLDISKHTDIDKTSSVIIQYEQPISFLIN